MNRYLFAWLGGTVSLLIAVAIFNLGVDPYGLFRLIDKPGFNSIKPTAAARGAMTKAYQIVRTRPRGLILGNSRSEVGLDPTHAAWPPHAQPVYNAALPGTGTATSLLYLQHTLAAAASNPGEQPKVVVWGIDVMDFLTDATIPRRNTITANEHSRLLKIDNKNTIRFQQTRDYLMSTLTLSALLDSIETIASQRNPYAVNLTPFGFNPMRDYVKISSDEGYWKVFRQKDQANIKAYLRRPKGIFDSSGGTSQALEDLKEVIRLCRQYEIELHLFTYPYHAHLLEIIRITGHWPALETWKRTVVQFLADEANNASKPGFPFWDFSGFNTLSTEAIPAKGDRKTKMRWYWEAGHFKSELGDLMVERMFGHGTQSADFGVLLTPANVEAQIKAMKDQEERYRSTHTHEINELHELLGNHSMRPDK